MNAFKLQIDEEILLEYFRYFGAIESFNINFDEEIDCSGFIQFESYYSAASILNQKNHYILGHRLKIFFSDSWQQPDRRNQVHQQSTAENIAKTITFLDLNDDCLFEILNKLTVADLNAISCTCLRLQNLANQTFKTKHTSINLSNRKIDGYSNLGVEPLTFSHVQHLTSSFGSEIQKLNVERISFAKRNRSKIFELIIRECISLKSLRINGFHMDPDFSKFGKTFFRQLHELSLTSCKFDDSSCRIFAHCTQLRKLTIINALGVHGRGLTVNFPYLESLTLIWLPYFEFKHLKALLFSFCKVKTFKSLELEDCDQKLPDEILSTICKIRSLESLTIKIVVSKKFNDHLNNLLKLKHLRELEINCDGANITNFIEKLAAQNKIERLHLTNALLNEHLINEIKKCKQLKSLKFNSMPGIDSYFIEDLGKELPLLKEFCIANCKSWAPLTRGIINFVDYAKNLEFLHLMESNVEIDDTFLQRLANIYEIRGKKLNINIYEMPAKVTPDTILFNAKHLNVTQFMQNIGNRIIPVDEPEEGLY